MQELKKVVVIGASGFGREALDTLEAMQAAAAEVAKTLATTAAKDYNRYANAGLR